MRWAKVVVHGLIAIGYILGVVGVIGGIQHLIENRHVKKFDTPLGNVATYENGAITWMPGAAAYYTQPCTAPHSKPGPHDTFECYEKISVGYSEHRCRIWIELPSKADASIPLSAFMVAPAELCLKYGFDVELPRDER